MAGAGVGVGTVGVAVGRRVGNKKTTVGDGALVGRGVTVGTRVLIGVGSAVGGVGPAVGMKLGKVGVGAGIGEEGIRVGVGGKICAIGSTNSSTIIARKTTMTNPANTPIVSACERVTLCLPLLS